MCWTQWDLVANAVPGRHRGQNHPLGVASVRGSWSELEGAWSTLAKVVVGLGSTGAVVLVSGVWGGVGLGVMAGRAGGLGLEVGRVERVGRV